MTLALCFNCGHTKFGAICPCEKCGVSSTGDVQLDIAFSDHMMSAATIGRFGEVIRKLADIEPDDQARFWCFIQFISTHHGDILKADTPPELAERVDEVLAQLDPITIVVEPGLRAGDPPEPPSTTVDLPDALFAAFRTRHPFNISTRVSARLADGQIVKGTVAVEDVAADMQRVMDQIHESADAQPPALTGGQFILPGEHPDFKPTDILALRQSPGCLAFWRRHPWVEA